MSVTVNDNAVVVTVVENTPVVTVTENTSEVNVTSDGNTVSIVDNESVVSVVDSSPQVNIQVAQAPRVTVNTGIGGSYDQSTILSMITDSLTLDHLDPTLETDLEMLRDLWTRVGNQIDLMVTSDGVAIQQAATTYTDSEISSVVVDLNVVDGRVDAAISQIVQEAGRIDLTVSDLVSVNEELVLQDGRITINADGISSTVTRLDSLDGPGGVVELQQSAIDQTSARIDIEVLRIAQNESDIIDNAAGISVTADDLLLYVSQLNSVESTLNSAVIELTANSATTSIVETSLSGTQADLSAVEEMLATRWGVTITEDTNGVPYTTGIGIILSPDWVVSSAYEVGDSIYFYDSGVGNVYTCLVAHTATTANNPAGVDGATYWLLDTEGEKTSFRVQADEMVFYASENNPSEPLFSVDGDAVILGTGIALKSANYGHATEPWFTLDPSDGTAEFRNISMTFSGTGQADAQTALNVADGADATQGALESGTVITAGGITINGTGGDVIIDGTDGSIKLAGTDGGAASDYALLQDGGLGFYYWNGTSHSLYNPVSRVLSGSNVLNDSVIQLPGYFRETPSISVWPENLQIYNSTAGDLSQDQTLQLAAENIVEYATDQYQFTATARLVLSPGVGGATIGTTAQDYGDLDLTHTGTDVWIDCTVYHGEIYDGGTIVSTISSPTFTGFATNTKKVNMTIGVQGPSNTNVEVGCGPYGCDTVRGVFALVWRITPYIRLNGVYVAKATFDVTAPVASPWQVSHTWSSATESYDITGFYFKADALNTSGSAVVLGGAIQNNWINCGTKLISYSSDIAGTTEIAEGTLGYLAVGR